MITDKERAAALEDLNRAIGGHTNTHTYFRDAILPTTYATIRALLTEKGPEVVTVEDVVIRMANEATAPHERPHRGEIQLRARLSAYIELLGMMFPHGVIVKEKKA